MILVTLGTQDKSFERLLIEIERLIQKKVIQEEVVVQAGYTSYSSEKMQIFDYLPKDEFEKLIQRCSCLITHGGVGSIFDGLSRGKKVIAVPRLSKYKEHGNDHQIQVVEELGKEGYILPCEDVSDIEKNLKKLSKFHPKKYDGNHEKMIAIIQNYIIHDKKNFFSSNVFQYFIFGIFFFLIQCFCLNVSILNDVPAFELCLIDWLVSYFVTIIFYCFIYHRWIKLKKGFLIFSFICLIFHSLLFFILSHWCLYSLSVLISSVFTLFLGYIVFMLIYGGHVYLDVS